MSQLAARTGASQPEYDVRNLLTEAKIGPRDGDGKLAVVAMSGGVDSAVTALLMRELGYRVVGMNLRLFTPSDPPPDDPFLGIDVAVAWGRDADGTLGRALARRGAMTVIVAPSRPDPSRPEHVARHLLRTLAPLGIEQSGEAIQTSGKASGSTGEAIKIPAKTVVKARIAKQLKDAVLPRK